MSPSIERIHEEEMPRYGYMIKCQFFKSPEEGEDIEDRYDLSFVYEEYTNIMKQFHHTLCATDLDISNKSLKPEELKPLERYMDFTYDNLIDFVVKNNYDIFYVIFDY